MTNWTETDIPNQSGKRIVITGANSGLGFHTSRALAAAGARVIMGCRSAEKADQAMQAIREQVPSADLEFRALNLADLASVRAFADALKSEDGTIDVLINNAGVMAVPESRTVDGFEMQMGTNHLGHFALTGQLLEQLSATGRIVCVASMAHRWTPGIKLDDLHWSDRRYRRWQAYGDSKLANLQFMHELARRLSAAGSGLRVAAAHPGYSDTNLQFVAAQQKKSAFERLYMKLGNALMAQSAQMGALPSLYAATAAVVESGDYIGPGGFQQFRGFPVKVGCSAAARDSAAAAALWAVSEQQTGVQYRF